MWIRLACVVWAHRVKSQNTANLITTARQRNLLKYWAKDCHLRPLKRQIKLLKASRVIMPISIDIFFSTRRCLLSGILLVFLFCKSNATLKPTEILSLLHNLPAESPWNIAGYHETYYPLETILSRWAKRDKLSLLHCYVTHSCQLVFTGFIWCNNMKCMAWNTWSLPLRRSSGSSYYFPNKISDNVMNIIISSISGMEHIYDFTLNPVQLSLSSFYFKEKRI